MSIWLVVFMAFVALLGGIAILGFRPPTDVDVDRWIARHDLEVVDEGRVFVTHYLSWVRPWRSAGSLLGLAPFLKWILYDRMDQAVPWPALWLGLTVVGYLSGCIIAEITFPAAARPTQPEAQLRPRELGTYLTRWVMAGVWAAAVVALSAVPTYLVLADPPHVHSRFGIVAGASGLALAAAASIRWAATRTVSRRQIAVSGELLRVDHAIRSASLRAIVSAGVALELLLISVAISELGRALEARAPHTPVELVSWLAAGLVVFAVVSWVGGLTDRRLASFVRRGGP